MKRISFAFMLTLAVVLVILSFLLNKREDRHEYTIKNIHNRMEYFLFDDFIPRKIYESNLLAEQIKKDIINIFDNAYEDKNELREEFTNLMNTGVAESPTLNKIEILLEGVTLNDIKGDKSSNNDPIILIRNKVIGEYVIIVDLSPNCRTEDRLRTAEIERRQQFAKVLFDLAFYEMTVGARKTTFWSFLEPNQNYEWYEDVKNFSSTDFKNLKYLYIKYDYNIKSLATFEILTNVRINETVDYFGTRSTFPNGSYTEDDMTIVVTSGFNIIDQLEIAARDYNKYRNMEDEIEAETREYIMDKMLYHVFMMITMLVFIILYLFVYSQKR